MAKSILNKILILGYFVLLLKVEARGGGRGGGSRGGGSRLSGSRFRGSSGSIGSSSGDTLEIVLWCVGAVLVLIIICALFYYCYYRKHHRNLVYGNNNHNRAFEASQENVASDVGGHR